MKFLYTSLLLLPLVAANFQTGSKKDCISCIVRGVHCATEDFQYTHCCEFEEGERELQMCMDRFKYCTRNIQGFGVKELTCPSQNCPQNIVREHDDYYQGKVDIREWSILESGLNCKIVVKAHEYLNGKLIVNIASLEEASASVYLMPNYFSKDYGFHGLFENGKEYHTVGTGQYEVPSDWTVFIEYNPYMVTGGIEVQSWV